MNALEIYSNGSNYYYIFICISSATIISFIIFEIYFYFTEYTQNINLKIDNISKKLLAQSGMLLAQSETIEKKTKQISQLEENNQLLNQSLNDMQEKLQSFVETSKQISQIQNKIKLVEKDLNDISAHSHINMDKIFSLENNIVSICNKYSELTSKISCNDKDMYNIDRRLTLVEKNFIKMIENGVVYPDMSPRR